MTIYAHLSYLEKHRFAPRQIEVSPDEALGLVVVIPCYDEPDLLRTLDSLEACHDPGVAAEVIVVINSGEHEGEAVRRQNQRTLEEAFSWRSSGTKRHPYHFLHFPELPRKHAGVGLARKIGMDEAVDRFEQVGRPGGIIACLDADSLVEPGYLQALQQHFVRHPKTEACSIRFAHPLEGGEFAGEVYEGIVRYELFLRYYVEALRFAGYPYAFHTVGSSMAVRSQAYQVVGGMNRRKAGEDFYFLHKLIPRGHFSELNSTCVIPSPRPGDRVPFGTGKAILGWLEQGGKNWSTYSPRTFGALKQALQQLPSWFEKEPKDLPEEVWEFFLRENFSEKLAELRRHSTRPDTFIRRFYAWFDGLKVLQYVHFARDHFHSDMPVEEAARWLGGKVDPEWHPAPDPRQLLQHYRRMQN